MKLTEKAIVSLTCPDNRKDRLVFDDKVKGLGLRITNGGGKHFLVQYRAGGQRRRDPLGAWGAITLEQARQAANKVLGEVALGRDPFSERKTQRAFAASEAVAERLTLEALLLEWQAVGLAGKRESYRKSAVRGVARAFSPFLKRRADALSKAEVVKVIGGLVRAGKSPTANRTVAYGHACFSWALGHDFLKINPFAGVKRPALNSRERVLSDGEVGAIARAVGSRPYPFGPMLMLLLLTAQRRSEVAKMEWGDISSDYSTWTQPPDITKNRRSHIVHLSPEVRVILRALPRLADCDLVFTTNGRTPVSGFSTAKVLLDREIAGAEGGMCIPDWRFHDFRRTCVTWLAGAGVNPAVADKILNHTTATGISTVGRVYQRAEYLAERKNALEAWARHVEACAVGMSSSANVIVLPGVRQ